MAGAYKEGQIHTDADMYEHMVLAREVWTPLLCQARDQSVGARWVSRWHSEQAAVSGEQQRIATARQASV